MSDDEEETTRKLFDLPERVASWVGDVIRENFKFIVGVAGLLFLLVMVGVISVPNFGIPLWLKVIGTFGVLSALGGSFMASMHFEDPEPDWNFVIEFNFDDPRTPRISRVTDAVRADFQFVGGEFDPDESSSVIVCRWWNRDKENPVAHLTWPDLPDDHDLLGMKPSAIEDEVSSLRATYEETHGQYQWVLDHLYMVIRRLDFRRTESQNAVLEGHVAPSVNDESISDVVDDIIPEDLQPDETPIRESSSDAEKGSPHEAVEEVEQDLAGADPDAGATETVAPDGGETDG